MATRSSQAPLIAVVGPTASGKSKLALELAQTFNGEIICADSRTLYVGMDIGTAKPSAAERKLVPHHLLDITTPDRPVSAATFQRLAQASINEITERGRLPIIVGGSGLYIDSVLFNYEFNAKPGSAFRQNLQKLSLAELRTRLHEQKIPLPQSYKNPRHLQRALEMGQAPGSSNLRLRTNTLVLGLSPGREELEKRVRDRVKRMLEQGLETEVRGLLAKYDEGLEPLKSIGYREFVAYIGGQISLEEVEAQIIKNTLSYAKRQRTWFKRNKSIHWINKQSDAVDLATTFLNK